MSAFNHIEKPIAIIQSPPAVQVIIETPQNYNQVFNTPKLQLAINTQQLNASLHIQALNVKFEDPIVNNKVCKHLVIQPQSQIIRDESQGSYDIYDGSYLVTPTRETQVLLTDNKYMQKNVVVNPIPKNYGLITWNGSYLTIS